MTAALVTVAVVGVLVAVVLLVRRRNNRPPDGITGFRRHMDALSSDAGKGLGWVPDFQALTTWDDAERARRK